MAMQSKALYLVIEGKKVVLDIERYTHESGIAADPDGWGVLYYQGKDGEVYEHILTDAELRDSAGGMLIATNPAKDGITDFDRITEEVLTSDEDTLLAPKDDILIRLGQIRAFFANKTS
jgi:hypothetical protein